MTKIKWRIIFGVGIIVGYSFMMSGRANALTTKLPYPKGQRFVVVQGYNTLPTHIKKDSYALDLSQNGCDAYGKTVVAAATGVATIVQEQGYNGGYGTELIIDHGNDLVSRYAHMIPGTIPFGVGVAIDQGQAIGRVGDTGLVAGAACPSHPGTHLHFAMDVRAPDGSLTAYDPEPISGYRGVRAGNWYLSDNDGSIVSAVLPAPALSIATATGAMTIAPSTTSTSTITSTVPIVIFSPPFSAIILPPASGGVVASAPVSTPSMPSALVPPVQATSTTTPTTTTSTAPPSVSILFSQPQDASTSIWSWYDDNWYDLGNGFSGTLGSLTLEGMINAKEFFASHVSLQEFKDPNYSTMVAQFTISDNAPFTSSMATTTFDGLDILLKPYFYYRLVTGQDYQNRSVILAGTTATGTMMWDNFVYGTGRVESTGTFMPFMVMNGYPATSTLVPPALTTPTGLVTTFDPVALALTISWSTSTDPDWSANPLRYEVNYSTSSVLDENGWGATLPISVALPGPYLLGVRAADNFHNVSAVATTTWAFPQGFMPYSLSQGLSNVRQTFVLSTTTTLTSVEIFTTNFVTNARNPNVAGCSLSLLDLGTSSPETIVANNGFSGYACAGNILFSFSSSLPTLLPGVPYQWIFDDETGNPSTQAGVQFYGTKIDTAGGPFSDPSLKNAKFIINGLSGPVFAN